jgi:hypothetical protein
MTFHIRRVGLAMHACLFVSQPSDTSLSPRTSGATLPLMRKLSRNEAEKLSAMIGPRLVWLGHLRKRMEVMGIDPTDKVYVAVCETYNRMYGLSVTIHYRTCDGGVCGANE